MLQRWQMMRNWKWETNGKKTTQLEHLPIAICNPRSRNTSNTAIICHLGHLVILVAPSSSVASSTRVKDRKLPRLSLGTNAAPPKRDVGLASPVLARWQHSGIVKFQGPHNCRNRQSQKRNTMAPSLPRAFQRSQRKYNSLVNPRVNFRMGLCNHLVMNKRFA